VLKGQETHHALLPHPQTRRLQQNPELQVCIAEALYDIESILSDPGALPKEEIRTLRNQIVDDLEKAWKITGRSEDELTGIMLQISEMGRDK